jgi:hypothetical protein
MFAFVGIAVATAGMLALAYGIFTGNVVLQLLGLGGVLVAYVLSAIVKNLRKEAEKKP